ncbi:hypothetical protein ElyMa_005455200 [Elysia marginata]|uniref:Uncharacterized protein n=1 Tax=Elysia marginata TaxID=1093978 RepID=A0AAV4EPQ3_9GAST|nr:hypothetical protein ElyMa_005455200 [Elysia marginata]
MPSYQRQCKIGCKNKSHTRHRIFYNTYDEAVQVLTKTRPPPHPFSPKSSKRCYPFPRASLEIYVKRVTTKYLRGRGNLFHVVGGDGGGGGSSSSSNIVEVVVVVVVVV